jgi:hypothetical protein
MQNNEMNKLFAKGGMMDDSGEVVNGVEVPTGSLASEVADDIPAQLSEGEFVIPADVVRYIGLEKLMAIRDKAKQGLSRMEEMGQMGNADQVNNPDQTFAEEDGEYEDDDFEGNIDSIMAEDGGEEVKMAAGGYMTGADLSKAPKNSAIDVRYFKHADGRRIYITYINNRPMTAIPEGFTETDDIVEQQVGKVAEEKAAATAPVAQTGGDSGGESPFGDNSTTPTGSTSVSSPFGANPNTGLATPMGKGAKGIAAVAGTVLGIPALAALGIIGYDAAINAANNNALSSSLGANGFTTASIQAAQEAAAAEGAKSSSTPTSIAEAASNAAAAAQQGMTSLDAFIAMNQNTFPASQFDPMADTPAASQSNAPAPGTEGPPAPTASTVASGQGGNSSGGGGGDSGGFSGADAGGGGFGPSSAGGMAKGGMVTKRNKQPKKPTKGKGLAASKK